METFVSPLWVSLLGERKNITTLLIFSPLFILLSSMVMVICRISPELST